MDKKHILESLLFIAGEPVKIKKLAQILDLTENEAAVELEGLKSECESGKRGLRLVFHDGAVEMVSSSEAAPFIEKLIKSDFDEDLSQAALETLAIISYRGPVSRAQVEDIRGVNCSFILRALSIRGLVERKENPEDHRSHLYQVSFDFLRQIGVSKLEDLPNFRESKNMNQEV